MVLGIYQYCQGIRIIWITVGQGLAVLAAVLDVAVRIFLLVYPILFSVCLSGKQLNID